MLEREFGGLNIHQRLKFHSYYLRDNKAMKLAGTRVFFVHFCSLLLVSCLELNQQVTQNSGSSNSPPENSRQHENSGESSNPDSRDQPGESQRYSDGETSFANESTNKEEEFIVNVILEK